MVVAAIVTAVKPLALAAESTLVRVGVLENLATAVQKATGLDAEVVRLAIALYLAFPIAALNTWLPRGVPRHLYALLSGIFVYQYVFGVRYLHAAAVALVCYAIQALTLPIRSLDGWRHWLSAIVAFASLTIRHLTRLGVTASNVDDSVVHMMLTVKLYSLAYNLYDGTVERQRLEAVARDLNASPGARSVAKDRLARSIDHLPNLLEYLGYIFNPSTLLVGPAFEIREYLTAQQRRHPPPDGPSRFPRVLQCFGAGVLFMLAHVFVGPLFGVDAIYEQAVEHGPKQPPLWYRIAYAYISMGMIRVMYYGTWKLAEAATILAGFGYRPQGPAGEAAKNLSDAGNGTPAEPLVVPSPASALSRRQDFCEPDWEGTANVYPLKVEASQTTQHVLKYWNMHTQSWLERYIFKRAPRSYNRWLTFFASAFWHGFFPGYYLGFMTLAFMQETSRFFFATFRPILGRYGLLIEDKSRPAYRTYQFLKYVTMQLALVYCLTGFCLLDWRRGVAFFASVGYAGHVGPVLMLAAAVIARAVFGGAPKREKVQ